VFVYVYVIYYQFICGMKVIIYKMKPPFQCSEIQRSG